MITTVDFNNKTYSFDLSKPIDISIAVAEKSGSRAWYVDAPKITPVMTEHFNGSVKDGGAVNFKNVFFNPHGHGTHTECFGHISREFQSVNQSLNRHHFMAQLLSIAPKEIEEDEGRYIQKGDRVITASQVSEAVTEGIEALVIRTLPNSTDKQNTDYSATNPPYMHPDAMREVVKKGVKHILIDLPSVDKENDGGQLLCHHIFWDYPNNPDITKTITELIYVEDKVEDGIFLLNLNPAALENDASPSRPVLYQGS